MVVPGSGRGGSGWLTRNLSLRRGLGGEVGGERLGEGVRGRRGRGGESLGELGGALRSKITSSMVGLKRTFLVMLPLRRRGEDLRVRVGLNPSS